MAHTESRDKLDATVEYARENLVKLKKDSAWLEFSRLTQLKSLGSIGPGGKSIIEKERYVAFGQSLALKQARLAELNQKILVAQLFPRSEMGGASGDPSSATHGLAPAPRSITSRNAVSYQGQGATVRQRPGRQGVRVAA